MDTSEPSTNGISASNLYRLSSSLSDATYAQKAKETVAGFESEMLQYPWLFASFMPSIVAGHLGVRSVVLSGASDAGEVEGIGRKPRGGLSTVVKLDDASTATWLREKNTLLKDFGHDAKTRVMICENGVCRLEEMTADLSGKELDMGDVGAALPTTQGSEGSVAAVAGPADAAAPASGTDNAKSL